MKIGIIGCGLIGKKRAQSIKKPHELIICCDQIEDKAKQLAAIYHCQAVDDWRSVTNNTSVELIIVSTLHASLAEIARAAIEAGKHVLIEKPGGRYPHELSPLIPLAEEMAVQVRIGFNHRHHRAFRKARALVDSGELGELMFIRGRYGHGGRLNYDKEWRANRALSGGGELLDQGVHLIDLARWFLGEFSEVDGFAHTYYWNMPVDDNGFLLLKTAENKVAHLHASCTEWKNTFSFEIYGRQGKIDINGLGGSYGVERLAFYKMLPEMGPPETHIWEFPMVDDSWDFELTEFIADIEQKKTTSPNLKDAHAALSVVEKIYRLSGL